ncbi:hypothetical protein [Qipengyuania sp. 483]
MTLSRRDRAKVQAALVQLHDLNIDTGEVTGVAERLIGMGTPARKAYDTAFTKFTASHPHLHAPLQRLGQLIDATDDRTIASYNVALDSYISTGDPTALQSLMPTVAEDMRAMAVRTGDASFADGHPPAEPNVSEPTSAARVPDRPGHGPTGFKPQGTQAARDEVAPAAKA